MRLILSAQPTMPTKGFIEISYEILSASLERTGITVIRKQQIASLNCDRDRDIVR